MLYGAAASHRGYRKPATPLPPRLPFFTRKMNGTVSPGPGPGPLCGEPAGSARTPPALIKLHRERGLCWCPAQSGDSVLWQLRAHAWCCQGLRWSGGCGVGRGADWTLQALDPVKLAHLSLAVCPSVCPHRVFQVTEHCRRVRGRFLHPRKNHLVQQECGGPPQTLPEGHVQARHAQQPRG